MGYAAKLLFDDKSPYCRFVLHLLKKKHSENFILLDSVLKQYAVHYHITPADVVIIPFLNCSAPSQIPVPVQKLVYDLVGQAINISDASNVGVIVTPQHTNTKGRIWKLQGSLCEQLHNAGVNIDSRFALIYKGNTDARAERPSPLQLPICAFRLTVRHRASPCQ